MRLADFILANVELIVSHWEEFAATRLPAAQNMAPSALRDHAEQILRAIAKDLSEPQTLTAQIAKSRGEAPQLPDAPETAAQTHGLLRAHSGFDINQMVSEYRALRATVLRLWMDACAPQPPDLDDIVRFNEALDQAVTESISFYSASIDQARHLFLGMLGHDMRTPLQAIQMTAALLARLNPGEEASGAVLKLIRSGQRMQTLLDDLLQYNRVNLGQGLPLHREPSELADILADEVAELLAAYPDRRIDLSALGSTAGSWDRLALQRLLGNLVVNAIKYGARGAPVQVVVDGRGDDVRLEVRNQGKPMDAATMATLFDPLRRGTAAQGQYPHDGSLGLGLYIAREVARAHGGDIEARSADGETVFVTRLPRTAPA